MKKSKGKSIEMDVLKDFPDALPEFDEVLKASEEEEKKKAKKAKTLPLGTSPADRCQE